MKLYRRKIVDELDKVMDNKQTIVLNGARSVGKTSILYYLKENLEKKREKVLYFDLEFPEYLEAFNKGIGELVQRVKDAGFGGEERVYVMVDEVQYLDKPSSFIKLISDHHKEIKLLVSGSSSFDIKHKFKDSLVGRTFEYEIFPLSFEELLIFKGYHPNHLKSPLKSVKEELITHYKEYVKYGGYPGMVLLQGEDNKKRYLYQVIDKYIRKDIKDLAKVDDVKKFNGLLRILASMSGQLLNLHSLSKQANISFPTLKKYLFILEQTYILKLVTPFSYSPKVEVGKNPKIFFYDSGLQTLLWLKNFQEVILGSVFETSVFSELVKKYGSQEIGFWKTKGGVEVDFILGDKINSLPIEVKHNFGAFKLSAINSFRGKYKSKDWKVVGLKGDKESGHYIYPWEI